MIWDRTDLFIFLKSFTLGYLYILWPGGDDKTKKCEMGSLKLLTIDPYKQSHFERTLSILVILIGLSLLYDPAINW